MIDVIVMAPPSRSTVTRAPYEVVITRSCSSGLTVLVTIRDRTNEAPEPLDLEPPKMIRRVPCARLASRARVAPWTPPPLSPRALAAPWPIALRRFRGDA